MSTGSGYIWLSIAFEDVLDFVSLSACSDSATAERIFMNFSAEEFH
jgi:hypothetical protein